MISAIKIFRDFNVFLGLKSENEMYSFLVSQTGYTSQA
jgi:hypothetical protein